jgi:hypothetical protein
MSIPGGGGSGKNTRADTDKNGPLSIPFAAASLGNGFLAAFWTVNQAGDFRKGLFAVRAFVQIKGLAGSGIPDSGKGRDLAILQLGIGIAGGHHLFAFNAIAVDFGCRPACPQITLALEITVFAGTLIIDDASCLGNQDHSASREKQKRLFHWFLIPVRVV